MDININWEGPLSLDQAKQLNSDQDFGLYQFYGDHPVYGQNVLLYIGKAEKQTFSNRLAQHNWDTWIPSNLEIYVGRICTENKIQNKEWARLIDLSERIQIYSHSPAFNTSNLNKINSPVPQARVMNWGMRKSLLPDVSVKRWEGGSTVGHVMPKNLHSCG